MHRKTLTATGHAAGDHATRPFDQPLKEDDREDGPSYVEAVLFGRRRAPPSADLREREPFKPRVRPHMTAAGEFAPRKNRKGTNPCAS
jgi:hypothetical protein